MVRVFLEACEDNYNHFETMDAVTSNKAIGIIIAYLMMVIIRSTTPLAIKWSSQGVDFITGLSARMVIGTFFALLLTFIWNTKFPLNSKALRVYLASAAAIYGAMMLVYWGAQYISSGLVAVIYGLTPIVTTLFANYLLHNEQATSHKILGALFGLIGVIVIFSDQLSIGERASFGIATVLLSVVIYSLSAVWIKRLNANLPAITVTSGGLVLALPFFIITYLFLSEPVVTDIPIRTIASILYLGIIGSVIGFLSYYYVLANLPASTVALATLITPVSALLLGNWLNNESVTPTILFGTGFVLAGVAFHQWQDIFSKYRSQIDPGIQ